MTIECANCRRQSEQFSEFAQIVSHDLQSPVNKIISFLDLLKKQLGENFDPKSTEYVERIHKNAATLTVLMKKLRDYAHVVSSTEKMEPVDFNQVLRSIQQNLQGDIDRTQASVICDSLPILQGRPHQLNMLWHNMLHNALVHHGERPPQIHVRATENPTEWRFSIQDNGPGVKQDDYVKIFQIFPRMEHQTGPSTATGLAIAKKIVENHGGKIWVESDPRNGSTFVFTLPRN